MKKKSLVMSRWVFHRKSVVRRVLKNTAFHIDRIPDRCRPFAVHWAITSPVNLVDLPCDECKDHQFDPYLGFCVPRVDTIKKSCYNNNVTKKKQFA